ncbi:MAG TPA: HIT domain-containing protein [Thermotogota bacterium]|nr:HIT domain-containing protein [Thermotogota bacterium]HRW91414.1 HIT domain-containing protein [Thermotogota bacterium]
MDCPFCQLPRHNPEKILFATRHFFCVEDKYPVNPGHVLVVSRRHVPTVLECEPAEWKDLEVALRKAKEHLEQVRAPSGFNVGFNVGQDAGQTIFHAHVHVISRYPGDTDPSCPEPLRVKIPRLEYLRDNDLFKKVIYSEAIEKRIQQRKDRLPATGAASTMELRSALLDAARSYHENGDSDQLTKMLDLIARIALENEGEEEGQNGFPGESAKP